MRPETIKILEENIRGQILDIGLGNDFLCSPPTPKATKSKNKQVGLHPTILLFIIGIFNTKKAKFDFKTMSYTLFSR